MNLATAYARGKSLDDWLSPILVKELRQGMRARAFVISFLLLQVFLFVLVMGNVAAQDDRATLDVQNHFFWIIVGFALLILMPLRGLVAISSEARNRTMETIMLTRLTAWRVVFGKWSALFAQSLLFGSAVLPYVVLRYFIGGNDVVTDLGWIMLMLWLSGVLIAATIAVSGMANAVVRIIVLVGIVIAVSILLADFDSTIARAPTSLELLGWLAILGFFLPALLFELTASSIAPASENHAITRRILALLFFASACGMETMLIGTFKSALTLPLVVLIAVCYYEMSEKPRLLPRMAESFARWGLPGKIAAVLFLPGWPSGLVFSLIVVPLAIPIAYGLLDANMLGGWFLIITATLGSVLPPVLICHLFWPRNSQVLLMVVLYNLVLLGVSSLLEGLTLILNNDGVHPPIDQLLAFLPSLPVLSVVANTNSDWLASYAFWYLLGNGTVVISLVLVMLLSAREYFRQLFALVRSPAKPAAPPALEQPSS